MQYQTSRAKSVAIASMFTCLALIFSYVEALMPAVAMPGVKLGLANLVIIIALYEMNFRYAFAINLVRIVISGLLFSGLFGMLYSMAGGLLSLIVMWLLKKTGIFSMIGVSMAGGLAHNLGQLLVAAILVSNLKMFIYFPILMFSGIASG
ncbi:MAG: Gx transporter family protein, partial [Eubacteriaceae bacterium]|nr:Gx transporter family protein [Eubacteriaceae bacterium]